jgi:hypothetical protein
MWFRVRASTALENPKHDGLRCNALVSQPRIAPEPGLRQTRRHVGSWQHSRRTHGWIATFSRRFRNWLVVCHSEDYWISHSGATWGFFEESEIFGNEISWIVQTWNTRKSYHIFKGFFIFVDLFGQNAEKDFVAFERPFETWSLRKTYCWRSSQTSLFWGIK